jgi:hypothetical protein
MMPLHSQLMNMNLQRMPVKYKKNKELNILRGKLSKCSFGVRRVMLLWLLSSLRRSRRRTLWRRAPWAQPSQPREPRGHSLCAHHDHW